MVPSRVKVSPELIDETGEGPGVKGQDVVSPKRSQGNPQIDNRHAPKLELNNSTARQHQQPTCWMFSHLQKSGGSSVKIILRDGCKYCKVFTYDVPEWCSKKPIPSYTVKGNRGKVNVVVGGYTEALRFDPRFKGCAWFTVFRHPIPRLVSAFFYCKRFPEDKCCGTKRMPDEARHSITAFAKYWGNFAVRQFAMGIVPSGVVFDHFRATKGREYDCSKDSGWYWLKLYLEETSTRSSSTTREREEGALYEMLQQIKDLVSEQFAVVGILEEFDSTISLFDSVLGIPGLSWRDKFSKYGVKNAGSKHAGSKNAGSKHEEEEKKLIAEAWTNSELKSYIDLDILLYDHAVSVFRQQARFYRVD